MNLIRLKTYTNCQKSTGFLNPISCILFFFTFSSLHGIAPNNFEDRIIALEKKIKILVNENAKLSGRIRILEEKNLTNDVQDLSKMIPKEESKKKKFFDKFRLELESSSIQNHGPWTNPGAWKSIRKRMSEYSVRETLGKPTRLKTSLNPGIETVYLYSGDLNSDGVKEEGYVNFKDKRVVSFKSPHP